MLGQSRFPFVAFLLLATSLAFGQGSAGAYGQGMPGGGGFGGGGMGGGRGGFAGGNIDDPNRAPSDKAARPDEEGEERLWETRTAILTPGDRVEFKIPLKKGETLLSGVTSDAFDPALTIEDSNKKELIRNDDRAEGDQSPFLIFRAPDEGTYTLKVICYKPVSGGKFTVKFRSILSGDARLGKTRQAMPDERANRFDFRLAARKGKVYHIGDVVGLESGVRTYGGEFARLIGPTGVEAVDYKAIPTRTRGLVFQALADGDYYLEFNAGRGKEIETNFEEVPVLQSKPTDDQKFDLPARGLRIIEFAVKPGLLVRSTLEGANLEQTVSAPAGEQETSSLSGGNAYGNNRFWLWFRMNRDSDLDIVRVFHGDGTARLAVSSSSDKTQPVHFTNSEVVPTWGAGTELKNAIRIGDSQLFLMKSAKSDLMRVQVEAAHFQPQLDIFRLSGELANSLCDRKTHTASDDLYFPEPDVFLIRFSCDGDGGSGDFTMKRSLLTPAPYALGTAQTMKLDGVNFGLYSVTLEAGKRYQLTTDQPETPLRADLLDEDGQFLVSQRIRFDKVEVQYFVPTRSGVHRLWLRGQPGERHFKFEVHVPPTVGG